MLPATINTNVERFYLQGKEGFLKAEVYISRLSDGRQVVCKDYSRFQSKPLSAKIARYLVQREYSILKRLQSWAHAPKVYQSDNPLLLLQEYIPGKTIHQIKVLDPAALRSARKAVRELHQFGIAHNDVRASNVIIKADNSAVLIDFTSAGSLPAFMGKLSRWFMLHDLRHAIKFKRKSTLTLTAKEERLLQKPKWLQWQQRVWKEKILPVLKGR